MIKKLTRTYAKENSLPIRWERPLYIVLKLMSFGESSVFMMLLYCLNWYTDFLLLFLATAKKTYLYFQPNFVVKNKYRYVHGLSPLLLGNNLHTVKHTDIKYIVQWVLTNIHTQVIMTQENNPITPVISFVLLSSQFPTCRISCCFVSVTMY